MNNFVNAANKANQDMKKIDETSSDKLLENSKSINKIKKMYGKYKDKLVAKNLDELDTRTIIQHLDELQQISTHRFTMCKVVTNSDMIDIIKNFKDKYLCKSFARRADLIKLIEKDGNTIENLYQGLRLDYAGSKFTPEDEYYGILCVQFPRVSVRVPVAPKFKPVDSSSKSQNYIADDNDSPFTGLGFIQNSEYIPEFYISMDDKKIENRENICKNGFPMEAFDIIIYRLNKDSKNLTPYAIYDCGDNECAADDEFVIFEK